MIDSQTEHVISFAQASDESPRRRRGRKVHISCFYRWSTVGCKGIVLESIQIGSSRCTSREALQRFYERLSEMLLTGGVFRGPSPSGSALKGRTSAQRERASAAAGRRLIGRGA
jgi:Protein of unknown function (DUF1580)